MPEKKSKVRERAKKLKPLSKTTAYSILKIPMRLESLRNGLLNGVLSLALLLSVSACGSGGDSSPVKTGAHNEKLIVSVLTVWTLLS